MTDTERSRGRLLGVLKIVLALALLTWVATTLPWRDQLIHRAGEQEHVVQGELRGVWREDRVTFVVDPEERLELPAAWPEEVRASGAAGVVVERSSEAKDGYDWRPGMPRVFRGMSGRSLAIALLMVVAGTLFGTTRWWRLLNLANCTSTWWNTFRLSYLGMFFNLVVPGLTGGDVVKAVFVVREHPERRPQALMTVVLDRMIGLWALITLATGVIWSSGGDLASLKLPVGGVFLLATGGMTVVLSARVRSWFRLDRLITRLPMGDKIERLEESARVFQGRPRELIVAFGLSICNHLAVIGSAYALGHGFGDALGYSSYVGIVSVGNVISSLPISPGGWGVGEFAYRELFELAGSPGSIGVAVSVSYRLCTVVLGLAGGLFLLTRGTPAVRESMREAEAAMQEAS